MLNLKWLACFHKQTALIIVLCCSLPLRARTATAGIDFERQVNPIFVAQCQGCHSQTKRSGGLSLATYTDALDGGRSGATIKPGSSNQSLLVQRITGEMQPRMPLGGAPLSPAQIEAIRSWIDEGARQTPASPPAKAKWEAPLALQKPAAPNSPWAGWAAPVDRFVASYLVKNGIAEPELISDTRFARRAYLDIWGLLPSPDDLQAFTADRSAGKRQKLVERLLADNTKYAEHWISFWNDLLRNDEGVNYYSETASRKSITDWLLPSLQSNLPYDQFVAKLINPDDPSDPDGFLVGVNWRGTVSASQTPALQAAQNTAQIFLGINLKCNSCHDSFISRWKLKDAYSLASYFSEEEKLQLYRCDVAQQSYATPAFLYPELNRPLSSNSVAYRRATAAAIFTDPRNGRLPRTVVNRFWERLLGRGLVENVDEMDGEPWNPELLDWLAADFVAHGYDLKHLIATIITSRTYQLPAVSHNGQQQPKSYVFRGPEVRRMTAEQFSDAIAAVTGDWHVAPPSGGSSSGSNSSPVLKSSGKAGQGKGVALQLVSTQPEGLAASRGDAERATVAAGNYSREWRIAANSLTRALGRPIRDQVFSTRDNQATTIQAIELVNGETLTHWLSRGARRMLGQPPPEPQSLYSREVVVSSSRNSTLPPAFDLDVSRSQKIYLIVQDALSTAPDKAAPLWSQPEFDGPAGKIPLSALKPVDGSGLRDGNGPITMVGMDNGSNVDALRVKLPSVLVYNIAGQGFTHFRSGPGFENRQLAQGEKVQARFFVFNEEPDMDRLVPPNPATPLPTGPALTTVRQTEDWVFRYALGRSPSPGEKRIADAVLRQPERPESPSAQGLSDLLWAVVMKPEFQLIY